MDMPSRPQTGNTVQGWIFSRTGVATIVCIAILAFLIYEGHGAHLLGLLPYALLLACPLMHIFMHGGHHHGSHQTNGAPIAPSAIPTDGSGNPPASAEKPAATPQANQHQHRGC